MAQPPRYDREKDFAENQGSDTDHPALNNELDRVSNSINAIEDNLSLLQADDGKLRPNVITYESLSQELIEDISADVRADVQDELDRADAAATKAETEANRAEAAVNSITDEVQRSEAAAATAIAKAGEAQTSATAAQAAVQDAEAAAQEIKETALIPRYAADGTADALVVRVNEPLPYKDLDPLFVRVVDLNQSTAPTIQFIDKEGGTSPTYPIVKGSNAPLAPGDMTEEHIFQYNANLNKFVLLNPTTVSGTQAGGLPIGAGCWWMGTNTPKDFLDFRAESYAVSRIDYPEFVDAVWCGDAYNLTADFFYRTSDAGGTIRNSSGDWLWMPIGDLYFMRGRDSSGTKHPYQYEDWAIENITGTGSKLYGNDGGQLLTNPMSLATGAFQSVLTVGSQMLANIPYSTADYLDRDSFDASRVVKTDTETRPMNFPVKWIIRAANSTVYENGVDVVALKNQVDGIEAIVEGIENGQGAPVGSIVSFSGRDDSIPPGWVGLGSSLQSLPVSQYPGFTNKVWCGPDYNDDADFFYRCDNVDGTGRNVAGQYITLPVGDLYFMRGRDSSGSVHPYKYQSDATKVYLDGNINNANTGLNDRDEALAAGSNGVNAYQGAAQLNRASLQEAMHSVYGAADETRPMNFPVKWIIKLFDGVSNPDMMNIQELIEAANNNSVPLGTIMESGGTEADPGYIKLGDEMIYFPINQAPDLFNKVWVGESANDTAAYFFRCDSDGTRILDGTHFAIPSKLQYQGRYVVETGEGSDNRWFRLYNDGSIEQGGRDSSTVTGTKTITFLKEMANTSYNVIRDAGYAYAGTLGGAYFTLGNRTTTTAEVYTDSDATAAAYRSWQISGIAKDAPPVTPRTLQIKAWGAVVNQGLADMSRIQGQIAELNNHLVASTIIYPNGGTAEAPENVTNNQRYVMDNPYPGYYVQCEAQLWIDGKWGDPSYFAYGNTSIPSGGTRASQFLPDDSIVIQTGTNWVVSTYSSYSGNPFGNTGQSILTAPCRVIVTRLGKIQ